MTALATAGDHLYPGDVTTVREVIDLRLLHMVFQPIVDLRTSEVVGYEALVRGPAGSPLETPGALFAAAEAQGATLALDRACQEAALRDAREAGVHRTCAIFINVEPRSLAGPATRHLQPGASRAPDGLTVVAEITERALVDAPAGLLARTARLREAGGMLALDDVGVDPRSLALLPLVAPDVVKLDMSIVHTRDLRATARSATAVHAHAERTGAHVVAEGIETREHLETALALGADLGQGWLYGRPAPLPREAAQPARVSIGRVAPPGTRSGSTPYEQLSAHQAPRRGTKGLLLRMSLALEAQVAGEGESAVVVSTFQDASFFTPATRRRYRRLARRAAFVGALGVGLDEAPELGVRGASLDRTEALRGEWDVCALGPYLAAAFAARDLGDAGPDDLRRFDFVMTHDRDAVVAATRALVDRVAPT